jgi:hypothetical protein
MREKIKIKNKEQKLANQFVDTKSKPKYLSLFAFQPCDTLTGESAKQENNPKCGASLSIGHVCLQ